MICPTHTQIRRQSPSAVSLLQKTPASYEMLLHVVWPHAIHNCVPVRIIHARDLSNSSMTLTSKGHTRLFSRFRLVSNKIRPACVSPLVIETEEKNRTDYRLPGTDLKDEKFE